MPLVYTTNSTSSFNLSGSGATIFTYTMTANGRAGVSLWLENLSNGAATLTVSLETLDSGDNTYGSLVETYAKPSGPTRFRLELERTVLVRNGFKLRIKVASTGSSNSSVACTWYVFDPNYASDVGPLSSEVLDSIIDGVWEESFIDHYEVANSFAELLAIITSVAGDAAYYSEQILEDTGSTGVAVAAASKSGYALAANGMDSVTLPAGIISQSAIDNGAITAAKFGAGAINAAALAADVVQDIWMGTQLTETYAAQGVEGTPAQLLYMILSAVSQFEVDGQTITCRKLNGTATAMTFGMDSDTNPTVRFRT